MSSVIVAVGFANGTPCPHEGQYLRTFDFDAFNGGGYGTFTWDARKAMRFATKGNAMEYWRTVSKVKPTRPDGQPNRPLTALSVEIKELP